MNEQEIAMKLLELLQEKRRLFLYTLRHKRAFLKVEKELLGKNTLRGYLHDVDKLFLYGLFWLPKKKIQQIHRQHNKHHVVNDLPKKKSDCIEAVIDWECARYTKQDKPLNAYETLMQFYPTYQDVYLPIIKELLPHQVPQKVMTHKGVQQQSGFINMR